MILGYRTDAFKFFVFSRYRDVERELSRHFNACINPCLPFPMPAATAGGTHLYDMYHSDKPWNWTGYVF